MAQRRMFTKEITTSDAFVDMPASSQLLYFHLGMEADDEGFIGNARMLSRAYGTSTDDLRLLIAKGFIIAFDSGVTVVKDWNLNNKIRKDRSKPTIYSEEKNQLVLDATGAYQHVNQLATNSRPDDSRLATNWQPKTAESVDISDDNQMTTNWQPNVRIGKDRLGKDRLEEERQEDDSSSSLPANPLPSMLMNSLAENGFMSTDLTPMQQQTLIAYVEDDGMEFGVLAKAIEGASNANARTFNYVKGTMEKKLKQGVKTVAEWDATENKFKQRKSAVDKQSDNANVPQWMLDNMRELEGE